MQTLFGISLTTLAGYSACFAMFFGSMAADAAAQPSWPHWIAITFGVLFTACGALRITIGHMQNDAPPSNPPK